ncbi:hypothetical protein SADUNF_Sadunf03G0070000 [Salix dunnii]|uniref:Uncharacterized protein n=1 Tax=Salix dunnii TaxID=1413687 RepID=A0A835KDG8_9ROSI|nr:hypothetical protein SADUNF_Sadunf03G0070000 [Salix dunnii]
MVVHGVTCLGVLQKGVTAPASKARIPPVGHETMGYGHNDATVDIPLDTMNDSKKKGKDLASWEADLKRREKVIFSSHG